MIDYSKGSLSLYFGLQEGRKADLEVVSLAAVEWARAVRIAATMLDPNLKVRIELVSAHEGSLSLNTVFDWAEDKLGKFDPKMAKHPKLFKTAIGLAIFLIVSAGPTTEYWIGEENKIELVEEDRERLDKLFGIIAQSEELKSTNQKFFSILSRDPAISSIGIAEKPGAGLIFSVPSEQFAERSGLWEWYEEVPERTSTRQSNVILESPDLSDANRVWRFKDIATGISFTAKMKDEGFLQSLKEGWINENLRTGIEMRIQIKFKEHLVDGTWQTIPSTIEVIRVSFD